MTTSVRSLSGLSGKLSSIKDNLKALTEDVFGFSESSMATGLRPVYRITTSKTLSDGQVTDYILVNTIPEWVKVKSLGRDFPDAKFGTEVLGKVLKSSIKQALDFQNPIEENAVSGILLDESPMNTYRYLVDIIFTNVPYMSVDGKVKMLAEDFILLGFPIQVSIGFIDVDGNFRRHPNEPPISTYGTIPPDFTGILGAVTQETFTSGDFFQGTFVGFEYLFSRYQIQEPFPIKSQEPLTRTLGRLLRWLATRSTMHSTKKSTRVTSGEATIGIPMLRAMGVMRPDDTRILSVEDIRKNIVFLDMPRYAKVARRTIPNFSSGRVIHIDTKFTFRDILELVAKLTNTEIYFNEYGRLTVSGMPKVREIATKKYDRIRVHDAIKGVNAIHHQATIDLSQIVNRVIIHKVFSGISAESPTMDIVHPNAGVLREQDEVSKYYADDEAIGPSEVYHYDDITDEESDAIDVKEQMIDYFRYYGMRGTCFMVGNPKIRAGDVIRISDVRSFGITGISDRQALAQVSKEVQFTIDNIDSGGMEWDPLIEKSFRLKSGIDHFYVWKVIHYIGPDGYRTKIFYAKEHGSYRPGSDLLSMHIARRRRGIIGEFK